jgi:cobalt-zinc-cadmium efflux system membrane fusion protein
MRLGTWSWSLALAAVVLAVAGVVAWRSGLQFRIQPGRVLYDEHTPAHEHEHAQGYHHEHSGGAASDHEHDDAAAVKLSENAQANVGLRLEKLALRPFERMVTVPGVVVERPGRSEQQVSTPLTGMVTRIWALQGETVRPGQPLFDLRLTHEGVVEAQAEFLRSVEELDVLRREIQRLTRVAAEGAIAGKSLLERTYEQQKLEGVLRAQRQRLLLHGLSDAQVDQIAAKRTLLSTFTVNTPAQVDHSHSGRAACAFQVEELKVTNGQHVKAGDPLCTLSDHCRLYIEGKAFEQDIAALQKASAANWRLTAVLEPNGRERQTVAGLEIVYLANRVEPDTRAFLFYVELPNELLRERQTPEGARFSTWRFKPGQRVDLLVPVQRWTERIVLPVDAVVQDGPESYVFEMNDGHFDRRAVRVEYRDQYSAVVANDGTLTLGKMVVVAGAYQVHLALKNRSGGAPDPHAGHSH